MYKSKCFKCDYDKESDNDITILESIMGDKDFPQLEEIVVGDWGDAWDDLKDDCQQLIDGIIENKDKFSNVKSLFIGDMEFDECEVSWIIQGNYSKLWGAMPQLEKLTIKGSTQLELGEIKHDNLKSLEIICGGLPAKVIESIKNAKLPSLERLVIYLGIEEYGFGGDEDTIEKLLKESDFPKLTWLGITDSDIQDEVTEIVFNSKYINQINTLDLSMGTLTDKGGRIIADKLKEYPNIKSVDLNYHYMTDKMVDELEKICEELGVEIDTSEGQEPYEWEDEVYYYPMLTE